jgi:hypothetical protein
MTRTVVSGDVFAHVARGMLYAEQTLTLVDPSPSTLWMSSAPDPGLGYLPTGAFLDLWTAGERRTDDRVWCVQGTLALLAADAQLGDATLLLRNPRVTPAGLSYDAEVLEGLLPRGSGACVLFLQWHTAQRSPLIRHAGPPDRAGPAGATGD